MIRLNTTLPGGPVKIKSVCGGGEKEGEAEEKEEEVKEEEEDEGKED